MSADGNYFVFLESGYVSIDIFGFESDFGLTSNEFSCSGMVEFRHNYFVLHRSETIGSNFRFWGARFRFKIDFNSNFQFFVGTRRQKLFCLSRIGLRVNDFFRVRIGFR